MISNNASTINRLFYYTKQLKILKNYTISYCIIYYIISMSNGPKEMIWEGNYSFECAPAHK